ncbi:MAG TPA: hypothetical protein VHA33_00700 [Candidatus Angelobacter sp.]|jgi:hypothetical protein|nr:hypothetical protein [Candidatus Angelobacter sp.]
MQTGKWVPEAKELDEQVVRLLEFFKSSEQLCKMLKYLVSKATEPGDASPKEYDIAISALGKAGNFDPQNDNIVRVQARNLRMKLDVYYHTVGRADPIIVEIPKGRYAVEFRRNICPPEQADEEKIRKDLSKPTTLQPTRQNPINRKKLVIGTAALIILGVVVSLMQLAPRRPFNFQGHIRTIYESSLRPDDREKLGHFVNNTYDYGGAAISFLPFENGVAVHFPEDQKSNPGSSTDHGFFIQQIGASGQIKWTLRQYPPTTDAIYKNSVPAKLNDPRTGRDLRCSIVDFCKEPNSGFGAAWSKWRTIRNILGKPVSCETHFRITIQEFIHGFLIADVPTFSSATCRLTGNTYVESFVLFKDNDPQMTDESADGPLFSNTGRTVGGQQLPFYGDAALPIWNCTPTDAGRRFCSEQPSTSLERISRPPGAQ